MHACSQLGVDLELTLLRSLSSYRCLSTTYRSLLVTAHCQLLTAHSLLVTAHCQLLTAYCIPVSAGLTPHYWVSPLLLTAGCWLQTWLVKNIMSTLVSMFIPTCGVVWQHNVEWQHG